VYKLYPYVVRKVYGTRSESTAYELVDVRCKVCGKTKVLRIPTGSARKPGLEHALPLLSTLLGAFSVIALGLPLGAAAIILSSASLERESWTALGTAGLLLGLVGLLLALWTLRPPYVP
jgi:hypothetical protein